MILIEIWKYEMFKFINLIVYKKLFLLNKIINRLCLEEKCKYKCKCTHSKITFICKKCNFIKCNNCKKKCYVCMEILIKKVNEKITELKNLLNNSVNSLDEECKSIKINEEIKKLKNLLKIQIFIKGLYKDNKTTVLNVTYDTMIKQIVHMLKLKQIINSFVKMKIIYHGKPIHNHLMKTVYKLNIEKNSTLFIWY